MTTLPNRLFSDADPPRTYRARVRIRTIEDQPIVAAKRTTRRSLSQFGQLTEPLVQEIYPTDAIPLGVDVRYRVVDGARRLADLRDLTGDDGFIDVLVVPHDVASASVAAMALALNYNRAPNPLVEAEHFDNLREAGFEPTQIAEQLGIPLSKVLRRLLLIDQLHPALQVALREGDIAIGVAEQCARLSWERQLEIAKRHLVEPEAPKRITAKDVSGTLRAIRTSSLPAALFELPASVLVRDAVRLVADNLRQQGLHTPLQALIDAYPEFFAEEEAPHAS
jgi:ParB-like chromosome segregation protein Spo0J